MTEYYINKRTKETSTDDKYYGQPGWLVCTKEEYNEANTAALRAERDELLKHLADALDDNYWHAEGCRGDNACVCWVSKSRAVLAKYAGKEE